MCDMSCSVKHREETRTINGQYISLFKPWGDKNCNECVIGCLGVDNHDKITDNTTLNLEIFTVILLIWGDLIIKHLNINNKNY